MIKGKVIYEGQSLLNGRDIIVIASWDQDNPKTGYMIQSRIMYKHCYPVEAIQTNADACVCGDCPRRPFANNDLEPCYVNVAGSPTRDYEAWKYGDIVDDGQPNIPVRLGSYGDPAAVPIEVWDKLIGDQKWTGYTHQWRSSPEYKRLCMASCDTLRETREAISLGWRTYSALTPEAYLASALASCPAVNGEGKNCVDCMACFGAHSTRANIKIKEHGKW